MWQQFALIFVIFGITEAISDISNVCKNVRRGDIVGNPFDCRSYFICGSIPTLRYCEEGLHFDVERRVCNWPEYAQCKIHEMENDGSQSESIQQDQSNAGPFKLNKDEWVKKPHPVFMAIDVESGQATDPLNRYNPNDVECRHYGAYFLPHPKDCRKYFICAYGHLHQHKCGQGTLWNYKLEECELSEQAICYGTAGPQTPAEAEIVQPSHSAVYQGTVCYPVFIMSDGATAIVDTGTTWISGATTTTWYPTGSTWTPTTSNPTGTTWNPTGTTLNPTGTTWNPTGTTLNPTGTTWNPTGTTLTSMGTPGTGTSGVTGTPTSTGGSSRPTPPESPQILSQRPGTGTPTSETTITPSTSVSTSRAGPDCPANRQVYRPYPEDCNKYYICIMGQPVLTSCPEGLLWDSKAEFCDLAKNVKCIQT